MNLIDDLLHSLQGTATVGDCPPRSIAQLESLKLPNWLYRLLRFNWFQSGADVARYLIQSVPEILREDHLPQYLACRMLPIGSAANGDPIVIRFTDDAAEVGMLSHEEVHWSHDLANYYHRVTPTTEEFFLRAVDRLYLPVDSFAARQFNKLHSAMRPGAGP